MRQSARALRFSFAWFAAAVLLLPLSVVVWLAVSAIFLAPAALFFHFEAPESLGAILTYLLLGSYAAAMGCCIGALQLLITRRYLQFELRRWREFSALGGFLAGAVSGYVCSQQCVFEDISLLWVQPSLRPADGLLLSLLLFLGLLSAVQFLTLRRQASVAALWIIAHLVSVPLVYALWQNPLADYLHRMESHLIVILAMPAVAALVTGAVMLRIVSLSAPRDKAKRKTLDNFPAVSAPHESRLD